MCFTFVQLYRSPALRFIAYWSTWGTHNAITLCWWNNIIFPSLPQRKMWPTIITKYTLEEKKKRNTLKAVCVFSACWLHLKTQHRISIHADFGYLVCRPHYISIPGGKWQINAALITVSISTWQCMFCMNEYWCTAFPRWFVFELTPPLFFLFFRGGEVKKWSSSSKETCK